jgi:hypothetical protein
MPLPSLPSGRMVLTFPDKTCYNPPQRFRALSDRPGFRRCFAVHDATQEVSPWH